MVSNKARRRGRVASKTLRPIAGVPSRRRRLWPGDHTRAQYAITRWREWLRPHELAWCTAWHGWRDAVIINREFVGARDATAGADRCGSGRRATTALGARTLTRWRERVGRRMREGVAWQTRRDKTRTRTRATARCFERVRCRACV